MRDARACNSRSRSASSRRRTTKGAGGRPADTDLPHQ
jgi:nucleoid-associated protein YgaU